MASMRRPVLLSERSSIIVVQQSILSFSRATWKRAARLSSLLFVILFIVLLVFYFRVYLASYKEESFEQQTNCTVVQIRNNAQTCKNSQDGNLCQLITGQCSDGRNRTLYSTWMDYEKSLQLCTIEACSSASVASYSMNESLVSVYISSEFDYGYLQRTARLAYRVARIIFYILIILVILTFILALVVLFFLHIRKNDGKLIQPVSSVTENSVFTRPPSISVQKVSRSNGEQPPPPPHLLVSPATSADTNNKLAIPMETTSAPADSRSQPLNAAALAAPIRNEDDIVLVHNTIL